MGLLLAVELECVGHVRTCGGRCARGAMKPFVLEGSGRN